MNKAGERLYNGIIKENPTFVLMLGMCPTLAVTTSAMNGLGMGLTTAVVLTMSNHFPVAESDSQPCENPRIYRNYSFICNGGAVTFTGISAVSE